MSLAVCSKPIGSARRLLVAVVAGMVAGCGQAVDNGPVTAAAQLCQTNFDVCVMPVFTSLIKRRTGDYKSCMDSQCHVSGGNGGRFTLSFTDMATNRDSIILNFTDFANLPNSPILTKPLAGDGAFHGGDDIFRDTADPCYAAIHTWLSQEVQDQSDARCASCAQIANVTAACGYVP